MGWSIATLRLQPSGLLDALAAEAARRPFALSSQVSSPARRPMNTVTHLAIPPLPQKQSFTCMMN